MLFPDKKEREKQAINSEQTKYCVGRANIKGNGVRVEREAGAMKFFIEVCGIEDSVTKRVIGGLPEPKNQKFDESIRRISVEKSSFAFLRRINGISISLFLFLSIS